MDDRWPTTAEYPGCCTPRCTVWKEPSGRFEWDHEHNLGCPNRAG